MRQGSPRRRNVRRPSHAQGFGFSLYELLVTLAVAAVLLGVGVPTLRGSLQSMRMTASVNALVTALHAARSTAITRAVPVSVCPSSDRWQCDARDGAPRDWQGGWLLFVDADGDGERAAGEAALRVFDGPGGDLSIQSAAGRPRVTYRASGFASGTNLTISFCDARGPDAARTVIVSNAGRVRAATRKPDGGPPDCPAPR